MSVTFSKTHLERLISGSGSGTAPPSSSTGAIAVLDSLEQSALPLLAAFASTAAARSRPLLILCIHHSPHAWHSLVASHASPHVQVVDLAPALPFPSASPTNADDWIQSHLVPPIARFLSTAPHTHPPLIVVDSLTPVLAHYPTPAHLARSLSSLIHSASSATLVLPLTQTPASAPFAAALTYLAPTRLTVSNAARAVRELAVITDRRKGDLGLDVTSNCATDIVVHVASVKGGGGGGGGSGGKVVSESVRMTRAECPGSNWVYGVFPPPEAPAAHAPNNKVATEAAAAAGSGSGSASDPTQGLSFNLKLTDKQREAKDKVVLPHFKMQQFGGQGEAGEAGGVIHYELDLEDDFDDEDPDADLDL